MHRLLPLFPLVVACSSPPGLPALDAATVDGGPREILRDGGPGRDAGSMNAAPDAASADAAQGDSGSLGACSVDGLAGECIDVSVCAARAGYSATAGYCPGPANIECCHPTPSVSDNPPIPAGYRLMMQSEVTPAMTSWAVSILHDPVDYPMFSTATMTFGTVMVLARVEWHPPDFQNSTVHRGVTLYVPV